MGNSTLAFSVHSLFPEQEAGSKDAWVWVLFSQGGQEQQVLRGRWGGEFLLAYEK